MIRAISLAYILYAYFLASVAKADYLFYTPDKENKQEVFLIKGAVTYNAGRTVTCRHPNFGNLYFRLDDIRHIKIPTTQEEFNKRLGKAKATNDANKIYEAGLWGLKGGLLKDFYSTVDATLAIDPRHEKALKVKSLQERMKAPIADTGKEEQHVRGIVKRDDMKIAKSEHFVLLHDTPPKPRENHKKPRAQERLDLLEKVYESFLLMFYSQGVELTIPDHRLEVVLFDKYDDFRLHSNLEDNPGAMIYGYWDQVSNVAFFFDNSSTKKAKYLERIVKAREEVGKELARSKDPKVKAQAGPYIRQTETLQLLIHVDNENQDVSTVSHECTHQMAGNTGLLPRTVRIPSWVHEGLATYFEAPADGTWSGIGAVSEERLELYRALEPISRLELVINDRLFLSGDGFTTVHGYAQTWALTHFLLETRFEKMMKFYQVLGEMPRELDLFPDTLTKLFAHVFGEDLKSLDTEWKNYMRTIKSEWELIQEKS